MLQTSQESDLALILRERLLKNRRPLLNDHVNFILQVNNKLTPNSCFRHDFDYSSQVMQHDTLVDGNVLEM